jgi:hypothetical protein
MSWSWGGIAFSFFCVVAMARPFNTKQRRKRRVRTTSNVVFAFYNGGIFLTPQH